MRKLVLGVGILVASTSMSWAQTTASTDTAYCKELAAQWQKYRAGSGSSYGGTVAEQHMLDCTNPTVQIPQIKKSLADSGHAVPAGKQLTLEQRVEALENKVK